MAKEPCSCHTIWPDQGHDLEESHQRRRSIFRKRRAVIQERGRVEGIKPIRT